MGIPDDAGQWVVSGTSGSSETWAFGWWIHDPTHDNGANLDASTAWPIFRDYLLGCMETDQVIRQYDYRRYSGGVPVAHVQWPVTHAGTDSGGALPLQVACVLTLRSATLNRQGRGRLFLPTCAFSMMSGSDHQFSSTKVNNLVDKFADVLSDFQGGGYDPVVVSRVGSAMHTITSVDADTVPDTQRRRRAQQTSGRHSASV